MSEMSLNQYIGVIGDRIYTEYISEVEQGHSVEPEWYFEQFRSRYPNNKLTNSNWDEVWSVFLRLLVIDATKRHPKNQPKKSEGNSNDK